MITCPSCQQQIKEGLKFCPQCGLAMSPDAAVVDVETAVSPPSPPPQEITPPPPLEDRTPNGRSDDTGLEVIKMEIPFEPLPEGAIIGGQYLIKQLLKSEQPNVHLYYTEDIRDAQTEFPFCVIKESATRGLLQMELPIACMNLTGDGLRPPFLAFQEDLGTPRYYVVSPQPGSFLGNVSIPVEAIKVINWGVTLAKGLAVLHQQQIAFGSVDARHIQLDGDQIFLTDFSHCLQPGGHAQYIDDVNQLAALLYMLMTGEKKYDPSVDMPMQIKGLFAQILTNIQEVSAADFALGLERGAAQIRRPNSIDLRVGRRTDVGMVRQLNEDSLCALDMVWNNQSVNEPMGVYIVADGMGGHEGGEVASGLTIKKIVQLAAQDLVVPATSGMDMPDYGTWLTETVRAANTAVYDKSKESRNDMGTTVVMALMVGDKAYLAHVGDSRAYHITRGGVKAMTIDHSLVERLVATGQITAEEARHHPQSNVIYRTIGDKKVVEVDLNQWHIAPDEYVLLCSDGLNGMITDERIHQIVIDAPSPQAACDTLIEAAKVAGGDDNITAVLIKVESL